jgi:pimeloyl-ACP methyl ester carboxylesterase
MSTKAKHMSLLSLTTTQIKRSLKSLLLKHLQLALLCSLPLILHSQEWIKTSPGNSPNVWAGHSMAYDSKNGYVLLFGGVDADLQYSAETWMWNGTNWVKLNPRSIPPARSWAAMTYDEERGEVVLFGGSGWNDPLTDTWVWNGNNWTQKHTTSSPRNAYGGYGMMAYDHARKQVVWHGGTDGVSIPNETWTWNGEQWTKKFPLITPPLRSWSSMVYDHARERVMIFGGHSQGGNDTWLWNGAEWTLSSPSNSPSPRSSHTMAYDSYDNTIVLHGGQDSRGIAITDTWVWNGTAWRQVNAATTPAFTFPVMAYDSVRRQLVMLAGDGGRLAGGETHNETWVFLNDESPISLSKPQVLIVPGILGTKLANASEVVWLSNWKIAGAIGSGTKGDIDLFRDLQSDEDGIPVTATTASDLFNLTRNPGPGTNNELTCNSISGFMPNCYRKLYTYNALYDRLNLDGYLPQTFPYDWRLDISLLAKQLHEKIEQMSPSTQTRPVAIVAHSMGGLIVAEMLSQIQRGDLANPKSGFGPIITLGTPFAGSVDAYLKLRGADDLFPPISHEASVEIGGNWTSAYQLLPRWDFAKLDGQPVDAASVYRGLTDAADVFPALPRLSALSLADQLWDASKTSPVTIDAYRIIGFGKSTADRYYAQKKNIALSTLPVPFIKTVKEGDGDGTVPLSSAEAGNWLPAKQMLYVNEEHALLPSNAAVLNAITAILSGGTTNLSLGSSGSPTSYCIQSFSPVKISVASPLGEITDADHVLIPDSHYYQLGTSTQISVPTGSQYEVKLIGTGTGTFDLLFQERNGSESSIADHAFLKVPVRAGSSGTVSVSGSGVTSMRYDYFGNGVEDTIPVDTVPPTIECTGCYFLTQNRRATLSFDIGYEGSVSTFSYNYRSALETIQFISTSTTEISVSGKSTTFSGQGRLNGQNGYLFSVTAQDGGGPGSRLDTVSISITGPNSYAYSVSGTILGGNIVVTQ